MDKKKIIFKLYLLNVMFFTILSTNAQESVNADKVYFNEYTDTLVTVGEKEILVRFDGWASGIVRVEIKVYHKYPDSNEEWTLLCSQRTNTTKATFNLDEVERKIVFTSKSGSILLTLPYEALEFLPDW
ncbi:hypothetical protein ACFSKL_16165 [Belliella marina]|uniref:Uncharacterized protein n=1 Tax=Belliella marina TaxID=1644146 RepID=A0ABW4VRX8_9BACT